MRCWSGEEENIFYNNDSTNNYYSDSSMPTWNNDTYTKIFEIIIIVMVDQFLYHCHIHIYVKDVHWFMTWIHALVPTNEIPKIIITIIGDQVL